MISAAAVSEHTTATKTAFGRIAVPGRCRLAPVSRRIPPLGHLPRRPRAIAGSLAQTPMGAQQRYLPDGSGPRSRGRSQDCRARNTRRLVQAEWFRRRPRFAGLAAYLVFGRPISPFIAAHKARRQAAGG